MTTTNDTTDAIVWFDCETTGLDPKVDTILEFCCFLTNAQLELLAAPYHGLVLGHHGWPEFESSLRMSVWAWRVHTQNGLLDELRGAHADREHWRSTIAGNEEDALKSVVRAKIATAVFHPSDEPVRVQCPIEMHEFALAHYIRETLAHNDIVRKHHDLGIEGAPLQKPPLAGSTIRFDRGFLEERAPKVLQEVHYRTIDTSALRETARRLWPTVVLPPKNETHRATPDIFSSLETMRCLGSSLQPANDLARHTGEQ